MRVLLHTAILLIFLTAGGSALAQLDIRLNQQGQQKNNAREQQRIAIQYYQNRDFDKAYEMFSVLYENEASHLNYTYYLYSLIELRNFKEAEKLAKKQSKKNPNKLRYYVDLGFVYIRASEPEKATGKFDEAIKRLPANIREIKEIANAFYIRSQTDYAIQTYVKGKELMKGEYTFEMELATMYERNGNYPEMCDTYLDHLASNPEAREEVQNRLQSALARDIEHNLPGILRESMLVRYQESPEEVYLNELLLWLSIQQKDFAFAFIQARSLDRRFGEDGFRVLDVAELAMANRDFDAAIDAYTYIMDKGKNASLYLNALIGFLETRYQQIADNIRIENREMQELETAYIEAIEEFGVHQQTIELLRDLAHIQAFYLDKEYDHIIIFAG
jgi:lipopolysaccharide biosynthesis regulator YciM